jgi:hypothetical protein
MMLSFVVKTLPAQSGLKHDTEKETGANAAALLFRPPTILASGRNRPLPMPGQAGGGLAQNRLISDSNQVLSTYAHKVGMQVNDLARKRVKLLDHALEALRLLFLPLGRYRPPARSVGWKGLAGDHAQVVPHFRPKRLPGCFKLRGDESALRRVPALVEFAKWLQFGVLE